MNFKIIMEAGDSYISRGCPGEEDVLADLFHFKHDWATLSSQQFATILPSVLGLEKEFQAKKKKKKHLRLKRMKVSVKLYS